MNQGQSLGYGLADISRRQETPNKGKGRGGNQGPVGSQARPAASGPAAGSLLGMLGMGQATDVFALGSAPSRPATAAPRNAPPLRVGYPASSLSGPTTLASQPAYLAQPVKVPMPVQRDGLRAEPLPQKNTFIHFESQREDALIRNPWGSAPPAMEGGSFHTKDPGPSKQIAHFRGECKPCAYYHNKEDGCRLGDECIFCHLCGPEEIKKRKKDKARAIKQQQHLQQQMQQHLNQQPRHR